MATNYTKTDNFSLNLYGDSDPADLRDGYNGSMRVIDDTLEKHLNRIETLEATDTHDAEVLKALGADTVDNATTSKTKWDQAATDATTAINNTTANKSAIDNAANNINKNTNDIASLTTKVTANTTTISNHTDTITSINAILTALDANTVDNAAARKTALDDVITKTAKGDANGYVAMLGDSWCRGYYANAYHDEDSMALSVKSKLNPLRFEYAAGGGAGFAASGENGTFKTLWQNIPDKNNVTCVIIAGGINDAENFKKNTLTETDITTSITSTIETIHSQAPNAIIHVIPMLLPVGATLSNENNGATHDPYRQKAYQLMTTTVTAPYVRIHKGGYRIGVIAAQSSDGGNNGDGLHLTKEGYTLAGKWIAHCVASNIDLWPTMSGLGTGSQIRGTWDYIDLFEDHGIIQVSFQIRWDTAPKSDQIVLKVPSWMTIGRPHIYLKPNNIYLEWTGDTITLKNVTSTLASTGTLSAEFSVMAGL